MLSWNFFFSALKLVLQFCSDFFSLYSTSSARQHTLGGRGDIIYWTLRRMLAENPAFVYIGFPFQFWVFSDYQVGKDYVVFGILAYFVVLFELLVT